MNMNKLVILFLLTTMYLVIGCNDDKPQDMVKEIKMSISSRTGVTYDPIRYGQNASHRMYACHV